MAFPNTYSSVTYNSPAGAVDITITVPSGTGITDEGNQEFYLLELGELEFKTDVPSRSENKVTTIATEQGTLKIKVWDIFKGTTKSIFNTIRKLNPNKFLDVEVTVGAHKFLLTLEQGNLQFNEKDLFTEITFTPRIKYEIAQDQAVSTSTEGLSISVSSLVSQVNTAISGAIPTYQFSLDATRTYALAYHIVRYGILYFGGEAFSSTDFFLTSPDGDHKSDGADVIAPMLRTAPVNNQIDVYFRSSSNGAEISALQAIARLASVTGCFFGYAFGKAYFIDRLNLGTSPSTQTELSWNRVLSLKQNYDLDPVNKLTVEAIADTRLIGLLDPFSGVSDTSDDTDMNIYATQEYDVRFRTYSGVGKYNSGTNKVEGTDANFLTPDVLRNAVIAYKKSLSFISPRTIEFKYRGFDAIKPYQTFTWNASTPDNIEKAENGSTTAIYRPATIKYNAKEDTVTVKAYLIN